NAESWPAIAMQPLLKQHTAIGKHEIRRGGAESDEVYVFRIDVRGVQRAPRSTLGKIDCGFAFRGDVTALDARALANPFIVGVHHLLEVEVGEHFRGEMGSRADDSRVHQVPVSTS